ncbi:MAG: esterase [Bacteroidetes bacterium]|nr:esterase [Bacteroidota bacterium]
MEIEKKRGILKESVSLKSVNLGRDVDIDFYLPTHVTDPGEMSLLLINDGQDMEKLGLEGMLDELYGGEQISPLLCAGIHAGKERKMEYGTSKILDYKGRGAKASAYSQFIFEELFPYIKKNYLVEEFKEKAFAGFSLGALTALDIVWNHPSGFSKVGIFSGSLWWRTKDQNDKTYSDDTDRIMHQQIRNGKYAAGLKFFFECGAGDEEDDRNNNGIIDSIDDTLDLIKELVAKGYDEKKDIEYLELENGKHDVATWAEAMPVFLKWGWGVS